MSGFKRYRPVVVADSYDKQGLPVATMQEHDMGEFIRIEDAPKALASKVTWKRMLAARRNGKMPCRPGKTRGRPKKKIAKDTQPKA